MRFFGRGRELAALRAEADLARSGRCRVVLIGGEAGVGKTRLVDEFTSGLGSEFRHARASCAGFPDMTALWPWRQLLSALGRELPSSTSTMDDAGFAARTRYADEVLAACASGPVPVTPALAAPSASPAARRSCCPAHSSVSPSPASWSATSPNR